MKYKQGIFIAMASVALFLTPAVNAANATQKLGNCLIDQLNGKERKTLARWVFFSMGAHPEISEFLSVSSVERNKTDKYVGELITRLLVKDCPTETVKAVKENPRAVEQSFQLVGEVAMQELMNNEQTMKAISNYVQYTDQKALQMMIGK